MYQHPILLHKIHCPLKYFPLFFPLLKEEMAGFCPLAASQEVIICGGGP